VNAPAALRVGTRGSALALRQTEAIVAAMQAHAAATRFETVQVVTHGDRFREKPITQMGEEIDRGIFNTALEDALLAGEVDLTTCSFKDVQSDLRAELVAASVLPREDPRDVLVSRHGLPLARLPQGAVLATSSPRRVSQLKAFRPDFRFVALRGNVPTRVERDAQRYDGVILAAAGLLRLGLEGHICERIDPAVLLPAPAQGAMGCEYLRSNGPAAGLVQAIQHAETEACVRAEKALLVRLSGGCFAPIGVLARMQGGRMSLHCRVAALDGSRVVEAREEGAPEDAPALVQAVGERIAAQGGLEIVGAVRDELQPPAG
jgi:hydroxymethylbilane synthase